jgi:serralysin
MPTILGTTGDDTLVGGAGADVIVGLSGDDRIDDGGGGPDELIGGTGNDTYYVSVRNNTIVEGVDEGIDTVRTAVATYFLNANVERLVYTGAGAFTGYGNALDNLIIGGALGDSLSGGDGFDQLYGGAGDDLLDGGTGAANTLVGGAGNDVYYVGAAGDSVVEAVGEGNDQVRTALSGYTLSANVENLTYTGTGVFFGYGNVADNVITGGATENLLFGYGGNDTLVGGNGPDKLYGGTGSNTLIGGFGNDIYYVDSSGDTVVEAAGAGVDYVYVTVPVYNQPANSDYLIYTGTGSFNATGWNIQSGSGDDVLTFSTTGWSTAGSLVPVPFRLAGGAGNDTYYVSGSYVVEGIDGGYDIAFTTGSLSANVEEINFVGSGDFTGSGWIEANIIRAAAGNDSLYGYLGADTLFGGAGNDYLDGDTEFNPFQTTSELPANADLAIDTLYGGAGDDIYSIRETIDVIIEAVGEGNDTVRTALTSYVLPDNVERLLFTGIGVSNQFNGTGNASDNLIRGGESADTLNGLGGNDTLIGLAGDDSLTGRNGANTLIGGTGNDSYFIGAADTVVENAGEGIDTVFGTTGLSSYTLRANFENFTWQLAQGAASVTGNALDNVIIAGSGGSSASTVSGLDGNDTLSSGNGSNIFIGGNGNDLIHGGAGADQFRYLGGEAGVDTITSFQSGVDKFALSRSYFTPSATVDFIQGFGLPPTTTNSTFLYDNTTGNIFYDDDGTGAFQAVLIANIGAGLTLSAADFIFV